MMHVNQNHLLIVPVFSWVYFGVHWFHYHGVYHIFSNGSLNTIFPLQFGCGKTGIFGLWYSPEQIEALNSAPKGRPLLLHQITIAKDRHYPYYIASQPLYRSTYVFASMGGVFFPLVPDVIFLLEADSFYSRRKLVVDNVIMCRQHIKWDPILSLHKQ
jgi:hypothetical protein